MRKIILFFIMLPILCQGQQNIPYIKGDYGYSLNRDKPTQGLSIEYTYLKDIATYYNARLYGFTAGLMYDKYKWTVPFYYTVKVSEWNEIARIGVIMDKGTLALDFKGIRLQGSYGFDSIFSRRRTDGRLWSIEGYVRYGKDGFEAGGKLGIGFVFDKYHTRIWYNKH